MFRRLPYSLSLLHNLAIFLRFSYNIPKFLLMKFTRANIFPPSQKKQDSPIINTEFLYYFEVIGKSLKLIESSAYQFRHGIRAKRVKRVCIMKGNLLFLMTDFNNFHNMSKLRVRPMNIYIWLFWQNFKILFRKDQGKEESDAQR